MTFASPANSVPTVLVTRGLDVIEPWVQRLAESLRPAAVEIFPVISPHRAMERLSRRRPRVVVLDEPTLLDAGWSLLRQIRRLDATLPCLMVLSRAEPTLLTKALQLSAYSVFEVPVDVELMGRMVARLLERPDRRYREPGLS